MPKVTVIVPNYNHARFLPRRLASIAGQTFQDFELIILDDASTDESVKVIRDFAARFPARVIVNEKNSGSPFKQWNRGVREARGEFIWLAESDDDAAPELLARLVPVLEANPKVGLAYCQSDVIDENDLWIRSAADWLTEIDANRWQKDFVGSGRTECAEVLFIKNTIPNASAVVFRRELFERVGGAPENMRLCGDWMLYLRILLLSDVAFVAATLNRFRTHKNTSRATTKMVQFCEEEYELRSFIVLHVTVGDELRERIALELIGKWRSVMTNYPGGCRLAWMARIVRHAWILKMPQLGLMCLDYLRYRLMYSRAAGLLTITGRPRQQ